MNDFPNAAPPPGALFDNAPDARTTHGDLFTDYPAGAPDTWFARDNAPTVTAATVGIALPTATTTAVPLLPAVPAHLTPATRISMVKGGRWIGVGVYMQYGRPIPLDLALKRVAIGRTVFVAREDADAVMESLRSVAVELDNLTGT